MPVHFIDNYPKNFLEARICKPDGSPLYGEIWVYKEFLKFNDNNFLNGETWYVKHNYNLSSHPGSSKKVEGQIDYLVLSSYGILIIEVKGGGIEVDENDTYYSYDGRERFNRYEAQNPFNQAKEYVHSLKQLIDSAPFIYRAVIFPHESNFELIGPQLSGYKYLFFSKKDFQHRETERSKNEAFYSFLVKVAKDARKAIIEQLDPNINKYHLEERVWEKFPLLAKKEVDRLRNELFPVQNTYGFDPDRIINEIILEENYEILKGLRKNRKVMVQGGPGTGKTVLATKFLAENLIRQQKGIYFCANKFLRAKMEHLILNEYRMDPNFVSFRIYNKGINPAIDQDIDFIIFDEAQEFFDKGLYELIEAFDHRFKSPKFLILYDTEQSIIQNFKDIDWYADFLMQSSFVHFQFDKVWRCAQSKDITNIANLLRNSQFKKIKQDCSKHISAVSQLVEKLRAIKQIIEGARSAPNKSMVLVETGVYEEFESIATDYFKSELEELTEANVNLKNLKVRYSRPILFRGLEAENVTLITSDFSDQTKVQNFIGVTRAIYRINFILWQS